MLLRRPHLNWTMRKKLLAYMLLLVILLSFTLFTGLVMLGRFDSTKKNISKTLDFQMAVFSREIAQYFESLAASSIELSSFLTDYIEENSLLSGAPIQSLTDHPASIKSLQEGLILPLAQKLQAQNCSGIFVLFDATLNSSISNAAYSRTGLYLYSNRFHDDDHIYLLRGDASVGKAHDIMPHRKWRMEFRTDQFPNFDLILKNADKPLTDAYILTDAAIISGTSDKVLLMAIPIKGKNQQIYGICGYEISADYFMSYHAQTAMLSNLTFLIAPEEQNILDPAKGLSCGIFQGYYRPPTQKLTVSPYTGAFQEFQSDTASYIGTIQSLALTPNNSSYSLAVMMPKSDYVRASAQQLFQTLLLIALLLFFAVTCCIFFSTHYLKPILQDLSLLKSEHRDKYTASVPEISDLFAYLEQQDLYHEEILRGLYHEKQLLEEQYTHAEEIYSQAKEEYLSAKKELATAQTELDRLAYSRKKEIDPDDYSNFLEGIKSLTKTEREIFDWYIEGKTAKDILSLAQIKESTLKYHNHNILGKLGVSSRKQMLRYAALLKQDTVKDHAK